MSSANELLEITIAETKQFSRRLVKGYEWDRIPRNDRLLLGT